MQTAADDWLRDVIRKCARAYRALSVYACQEAMKEIDTLPSELQGSPWALDIVARAYYEMANYVVVSDHGTLWEQTESTESLNFH
jgi:anaphase-promoting complex subunit 3